MKRIVCVIMALFTFNVWCEESTILGLWMTQKSHKNARIRIEPCTHNASKVCGKIIWLEEPNFEDGLPKIDKNNNDLSLQTRPLMNLNILSNFEKSDKGFYEKGTIYNPEDGDTYKCTLTLNTNGTTDILQVHGYVGIPLFGKTQEWIRVAE